MVTPSMTYKEMYEDLALDERKVDIRIEYLRPKAIKALKSVKHFPAYKIYSYKIPSSNNEYVISFYAESHFDVKNPKSHSYLSLLDGGMHYAIIGRANGYKHCPTSPTIGIRQINAYSGHFFDRYKKRFLKDCALSFHEAACIYLYRNRYAMPIEVNEQINRKYKKYGEEGAQAYKIRDGFCFASSIVEGEISEDGDRSKDKPNAICVIYRTFLSDEELFEGQKRAISEGYIARYKELLDNFQKESSNGTISLNLEP